MRACFHFGSELHSLFVSNESTGSRDSGSDTGGGRADPVAAQDDELCPAFLSAMALLGKRWNGLIIQSIGDRQLRYGDIKNVVGGISDAVLTRRLAELQHCEIVVHTSGAEQSAHGGYALTAKGRALVPALDALTQWAEQWVVRAAADGGAAKLSGGAAAQDQGTGKATA